MQSETPWYGSLAVLAFYMLFEAGYFKWQGRFFTTHMLGDLFDTMRERIVHEMRSDRDGARLCAWAVTIVLTASVILIVGLGIGGLLKKDPAKEIVVTILLLAFFVPFALALNLFNELCMSWLKKIRPEPAYPPDAGNRGGSPQG